MGKKRILSPVQLFRMPIINGRKTIDSFNFPQKTIIIKKRISGSPDLSIIIPVFERPEELRKTIDYCLRSLDTDLKANLIIVDNSLSKKSYLVALQRLRKLKKNPRIKTAIVHYDPTLTISLAKNQGVKILKQMVGFKNIGKTLVFLDSDIYLPPKAIPPLIETLNHHPEIAAVSLPSVWLKKGSQYNIDSPPDFNKTSIKDQCKPEKYIKEKGRWLGKNLLEVPAIHGCLLVIRSKIFLKIGMFSPLLAMHGEHVELSARLRDKGYKLAYLLRPSILHDDRTNLRFSIMRNLPERKKFILITLIAMIARNQVYCYPRREANFIHLIQTKWFSSLGIRPKEKEKILTLLFRLGKVIHESTSPIQLERESNRLLLKSTPRLPVIKNIKKAMQYLIDNFGLLSKTIRNPSSHQPLYKL